MKYYMAPMEGLTGYVYRMAYQKYFHDIDRYFTPFITNKKLDFKARKDIDPEHNQGMEVVPQILTNQAEDFISITRQLKQYGYEEVNLNLGCPSGTVVSKNRGAGFLAVPEELDIFLDTIFNAVTAEFPSRQGWEKIPRKNGRTCFPSTKNIRCPSLSCIRESRKISINTHRAWNSTAMQWNTAITPSAIMGTSIRWMPTAGFAKHSLAPKK